MAVRVPENLLEPDTLRAIADPSLTPVPPDRLGDPVPPPPMADAALALGKLALLLPAVLVATPAPKVKCIAS